MALEPVAELSYSCREYSVYTEGYADIIEGVDNVVDCVETNTYCEVDRDALKGSLERLKVQEILVSSNCYIKRIR